MASKRTDENGRAFKGSQAQVQMYVNERRAALNLAITGPLGIDDWELEWVSPLEAKKYREYQDAAFLRAVDQAGRAPELAKLWPKGGPVWDALAIARKVSKQGVVLVEAKSYPGEMETKCGAGKESKPRIRESIAATRRWLGVELAGKQDPWLDSYYQLANRLAHLYFFREISCVPAWLVSLCFEDDPHRRTDRAAWEKGLADARKALGLADVSIPHYAEVILPAVQHADAAGGANR